MRFWQYLYLPIKLKTGREKSNMKIRKGKRKIKPLKV